MHLVAATSVVGKICRLPWRRPHLSPAPPFHASDPESDRGRRPTTAGRRSPTSSSSPSGTIALTSPTSGSFVVGALCLGFLYHDGAGGAHRFVPMAASTWRTLPGLELLSSPSSSSRVVASRNGLLVVDLRRGKSLELCVFNPVTGAAHVVPPLAADKDHAGGGGLWQHYACTLITNHDDSGDTTVTTTSPASSNFRRLIVIYTTISPAAGGGGWSDEAEVTTNAGEVLSQRNQMHSMRGGGNVIVYPGGRVVAWHAKNVLLELSLDTLASDVIRIPPRHSTRSQTFSMANTLLGISPERGGLFFVQFDRMSLSPAANKRRVSVCVHGHRHGDVWEAKVEPIRVDKYSPEDATKVRLRWLCERSVVVMFTVVAGDGDRRRSEAYALSLGTRRLHGYRFEDQAMYLASLAERQGMDDTMRRPLASMPSLGKPKVHLLNGVPLDAEPSAVARRRRCRSPARPSSTSSPNHLSSSTAPPPAIASSPPNPPPSAAHHGVHSRALGFFHLLQNRFVPTPSAASRIFEQQLPRPSLDYTKLERCSRIVASPNGLLVLDQRNGKRHNSNERDLRLCVCNPMTGYVHMLPQLQGLEDGLGLYACALLTAEDIVGEDTPRCSIPAPAGRKIPRPRPRQCSRGALCPHPRPRAGN
ncbi:hypothetical protein HU200_051246 [Digitaria exilis]|uniref:Uncharacterized protein n=1 Tax=Digitaria exilis TaxID=1010633 RepID=A0A835AW24_9POAL|nr:hypothetical protein HU200_051246 [Digitaria exilis]